MVESAIEAGVTILGENYIQEAQAKIDQLSDYPVSWHFIGHLQRNKAKAATALFDLIHSVDSLALARTLDHQSAKIRKIQKILIQVDLGSESSKSGIAASRAPGLVKDISRLKNLKVNGLMTLPPFFNDPERARPYFAELRRLRDRIIDQQIPGVSMGELSMGMTGDFETAIEEGATLVRIGTALFGERQ